MANQPKKYKKFVATAATATLVASAIVPVASAASLSDIAGNTHEAAITSLVDAKIISGYADGTFKPNKTLTRSDVVKLLGKYLVTEGYSIPEDAVSSPRFSDLSSKSNKELLEYAAVVADAGVFAGSNGKLLAGDPITRENMAIVLVRMVNTLKDVSLEDYVDGQDFTKEVKDLNAAKAEARSAINVLDFYDITTATNFLPKNTVTRGQFATFLNNVIKADFAGASATSGTVTAINNTTVEVKFGKEIGDISALKFTIDGLEVKNAVVKQSDKTVAVLTTAVQESGKEYTVNLDGNKIGKFTGISAVLPTAINIVEKSQQSVLGNQVTVTAKVTVATADSAAGIPVTFNIINGETNNQQVGSNLNPTIVGEAVTNADGVATYTYTRYASTARDLITHDEVQAYSTGKATVRAFSKVYWGAIQPLTITEVTQGNSITNGGKKVYKVKLAGVSTNTTSTTLGRSVNIGFLENVNVAPDKAVKKVTVTDSYGKDLGYPGQFTTTNAITTNVFNSIELSLDANGEATFTLTGSDATVTPFVFKDVYANTNNTDPSYGRFDETELNAKAPAVTFAKAHNLELTVESLLNSNASAYDASFTGTTTYYYENGSNQRLYRDAAGNLATANISSALPTGSVWISNVNPLRTGEVVPAGFAYKTVSYVTTTGVSKLNDKLGNSNIYRYNTATASSDLEADLFNTGGRDYKAVLKDKTGKLAQTNTPVKVKIAYGSARSNNVAPIYVIDNNSYTVYKITNFNDDSATYDFLTNAKGEISFTIIGSRDSYATPTVYVDSTPVGKLDDSDLQQKGETVYFGDRSIANASLTVDGKVTSSALVSEIARFAFQTVDQNNKPYAINSNTVNTTQSAVYNATFQVTSRFSVAYVYADKAKTQLLGTVSQNDTKSFPVYSANGLAEIYVVSGVGNTVDVEVNASHGTYGNQKASATFSNQFNEGVSTYVRGKVVAIDKDNNRILLSNSTGSAVYELSYAGTGTNLQVAGSSRIEKTFEDELQIGEELHFTQATENASAIFDLKNTPSGVAIKSSVVLVVNGDQTSVPKTYDFGNQTLAIDKLIINGDNITLANLTLNGNLIVGLTDNLITTPQRLNDFALNNVVVNGDTVINRGDGSTFTATGSTLNKVYLNIKEHIALNNSTINELLLSKNIGNSRLSGTGTSTVKTVTGAEGATFTKEGTVVVENGTGTPLPPVAGEITVTTATAKGTNMMSPILGNYTYVVSGNTGTEYAGQTLTLTFTEPTGELTKTETVTVNADGTYAKTIESSTNFGSFNKVSASVTKDGVTKTSAVKEITVTEAE